MSPRPINFEGSRPQRPPPRALVAAAPAMPWLPQPRRASAAAAPLVGRRTSAALPPSPSASPERSLDLRAKVWSPLPHLHGDLALFFEACHSRLLLLESKLAKLERGTFRPRKHCAVPVVVLGELEGSWALPRVSRRRHFAAELYYAFEDRFDVPCAYQVISSAEHRAVRTSTDFISALRRPQRFPELKVRDVRSLPEEQQRELIHVFTEANERLEDELLSGRRLFEEDCEDEDNLPKMLRVAMAGQSFDWELGTLFEDLEDDELQDALCENIEEHFGLPSCYQVLQDENEYRLQTPEDFAEFLARQRPQLRVTDVRLAPGLAASTEPRVAARPSGDPGGSRPSGDSGQWEQLEGFGGDVAAGPAAELMQRPHGSTASERCSVLQRASVARQQLQRGLDARPSLFSALNESRLPGVDLRRRATIRKESRAASTAGDGEVKDMLPGPRASLLLAQQQDAAASVAPLGGATSDMARRVRELCAAPPLALAPLADGDVDVTALLRNGELEEALASLTETHRTDPSHARAALWRGAVELALGRPWDAMKRLDDALASKPPAALAALARALRGGALLVVGRIAEALVELNLVLAEDAVGRDVKAFAGALRGALFRSQGECARAIQDLDSVLAFQPDNTSALVDRGAARAALGRRHEALCDFTEALAIDPEDMAALSWVSLLRVQASDWDMAPGAVAEPPHMNFAPLLDVAVDAMVTEQTPTLDVTQGLSSTFDAMVGESRYLPAASHSGPLPMFSEPLSTQARCWNAHVPLSSRDCMGRPTHFFAVGARVHGQVPPMCFF